VTEFVTNKLDSDSQKVGDGYYLELSVITGNPDCLDTGYWA
jgi:hypothetical protein